ncbi:cation:proton antiporter [Natribaculum luteum]|uniref:Cation:proton antiporter n=1 Tax=Natribaculum luteum TaxID=1586232 RepID=A0ABD5NZV6_9EURY|nr:cation:proton antiporter [Natribaculum luteum]
MIPQPSAAVVRPAAIGHASSVLQTADVPEPIATGELLWLFLMLTLLLATARVLGELTKRFGMPAVVGELTAGIVLGPTVIDSVLLVTRTVEWVEGEAVGQQLAAVEVVSWLGLLMLIVLTGLETDLELIVSKARAATLVALASIVAPFAAGFAFAWYLPDRFVATGGSRLEFALFMAVAMSISAIPVIAKILMDMGHVRRDFGQLTLAAGMINDTVGWIMLALVAGLVRTGEVQFAATVGTLLWLVAFLGVGFTVGRRAVRWLFVWIDNTVGGEVAKLTTLMVLTLGVGSFTHALHLEAVLGAFVVGILVGQVDRFDYETEHTLEVVTMGVFAPIFFATAGLRVDLRALADPVVFGVAVGALAIAVVGKFAGSYVGARAAGLSSWEGVTIGAGLNARGAMEIVVATIGLAVDVLTIEMYSIIVMIAIVTSLMAPPMLRWTLPHVTMSASERRRIEREERMRESFVGQIRRILLPTRGGADTQYAARLLGPLVRDAEIELTALYVTEDGRRRGRWIERALERLPGPDPVSREARSGSATDRRTRATNGSSGGGSERDHPPGSSDEEIAAAFEVIERRLELDDGDLRLRKRVRDATGSVAETILDEAAEGYGMLVLGESGRTRDPDEPLFSETVDHVVRDAPCPTMVVSTPGTGEAALESLEANMRRILLPTVGTEYNRHAAEIAFTIARRENAIVEIVHVVAEPRPADRFVEQPDLSKAMAIGEGIVDREAELGREMGTKVLTTVEVGDEPEATIVDLANRDGVDLIVMGSDIRAISQRAFFGHRVERVVEDAPCPVAVISSV